MPRPIPQPRSASTDGRSAGDALRGRADRPRLVDDEPAEPPEAPSSDAVSRDAGDAGDAPTSSGKALRSGEIPALPRRGAPPAADNAAPVANDTTDQSGRMPPLDPTSTPTPSGRGKLATSAASRGCEAERTPIKKPLLASEALIEDLAPLEPARSAARLWCAALGAGFLLFGGLSLVGLGPGGIATGGPEIGLGCVALIAAIARLSYRERAAVMILLGLLSAAFGLGGPTMTPGGHGWGLLRMLAGITLPAALLFRARYRAYAKARWILGAAFAASLPFAVYSIARVAGLAMGPDAIGATVSVVAIGASLLGFLGAETTAGGAATALGVIVALACDVALSALAAPNAAGSLTGIAHVVATAAVFAGTSAMASLGLFQLLAQRFAADARRINIHAKPKDVKPRQPSASDWSTKE